MAESELDRAAEIATEQPYWNPRPGHPRRGPRAA